MPRDDERKPDDPKLEPARDEFVDESPSQADVDAADAAASSEPSIPLEPASAELPQPPAPPVTVEPAASDAAVEPEPPAASQPATASAADAAEPPGNVSRMELPPEIAVPPARPLPAPHDPRGHLLPLEPGAGAAGGSNPADEIFPPELRRPLDPGTAPHESASRPVQGESPPSLGQTMPRVQVMVSLAQAEVMFDQALEVAAAREAPRFKELVEFEIQAYDFDKESARRAADYRLRGPG